MKGCEKCLVNKISRPTCGTIIIICSMKDCSKCTAGPLRRKPEMIVRVSHEGCALVGAPHGALGPRALHLGHTGIPGPS